MCMCVSFERRVHYPLVPELVRVWADALRLARLLLLLLFEP